MPTLLQSEIGLYAVLYTKADATDKESRLKILVQRLGLHLGLLVPGCPSTRHDQLVGVRTVTT